jgi:superfamily II DNA or RNA helicase/superfamily II DNA/RNA helicase
MSRGARWARARTRAIEETIAAGRGKDMETVLLRNGFVRPGSPADIRTGELAHDTHIPDSPLTFVELARYSTYFALHPEHMAGREHARHSRTFPVGVKAGRAEVKTMLEGFINGLEADMQDTDKMLREAREMAARLKAGRTAPALAGLDGLAGLGRLDPQTEELIQKERDNIRLSLDKSARAPRDGRVLDFRTVVATYNQGISREEIEAWVWFKRSLGNPMTGWEDYFLKGGGDRVDQLVTLRTASLRDMEGGFIRTVRAGQALGKATGRRVEFDGTDFLVFRDEEGTKLCAASDVERRFLKGGDANASELARLIRAGALFQMEGELVPFPVYAYGNMYDRLQQLKADRTEIEALHGAAAYVRQLAVITSQMPPRLSVNDPDPSRRPKILCVSGFAGEFKVGGLRESTGIVLEKELTLVEAFKEWLRVADAGLFRNSSAAEVSSIYIDGRRITDPKLDEEARRQVKADARNEGEAAFERFLHEALAFDDQERLDLHWNRLYNGQSELPHDRVPVGFEASARFKQSELEIRPAQREGIAFMNAVGSGIIAYDVGVGKTLTAIVTMADAICSGKVRRPLVVVPNPTFQKWAAEITGFTDAQGRHVPGILSHTGITVNAWYNLGKESAAGIDFKNPVPERSITLVTYEGFKKIGFSNSVMDEMLGELSVILDQDGGDRSARDEEKDNGKYREMLGVGMKGTLCDIDTMGFDMLVIDEAHRCKNIFDSVKAEDDKRRRFGMQGAVSETGIKAFFLCNYIQRRFGRNVMLLTATPFTNSPLEIYSMLSLVAYDAMRRAGILNIHQFFELFVQETTEMVVNYKEEMVPKDVVKRFNNRVILQKLIYNHVAYKTGEEAGVRRPCKLNLPRVNQLKDGRLERLPAAEQALTFLRMTDLQREMQNAIIEDAQAATKGRLKLGMLFRALGRSLDNALSPFLLPEAPLPVDCYEFVEESPKIKYACACIQSVRDWHRERGQKVSGQVIYMNRGKQFFHLVKEYLEKRVGFVKGLPYQRKSFDEVEVITSEMAMSRKEDIKEAFLEGVVKVIIGTATIREGIDLQKNSTVLYNLYPEWNPTDIRQLEGRIWRQGNRFGYVRIVMPLVQDSMDVFVFQKLEEKTHRINDIWYRGDRGNVLDLESLDPEEVKLALLSDTRLIAETKRGGLVREATTQLAIAAQQVAMLASLESDIKQLEEMRHAATGRLRVQMMAIEGASGISRPTEEELSQMTAADRKKALSRQKRIDALVAALAPGRPDDRLLIKALYQFQEEGSSWATLAAGYKQALEQARKAENAVLKPIGMTLESFDMETAKSAARGREAEQEARLAEYKSDAFLWRLWEEASERKSAMAIDGKEVADRVEEFKRYNHLLGYLSGSNPAGSCQVPGPEDDNDGEGMLMLANAMAMRLRLMNARNAS